MTTPQAKPDFPAGIYGITAEKFSNGRTNVEVVRQMLAGGIRIIQYREKRPHKSFAEMLAECRAIRALTRAAGAVFIVNDYPSLALLADADGVHVGQDDMSPQDVRRMMGPDAIVGLTVKSFEQAAAVPVGLVDYACVGGVFATGSKHNPEPPVGLVGLTRIAERIRLKRGDLPVGAIAGITAENAGAVIAAGADGVAVISEIFMADDVAAAAARLRAAVEAARGARA